MMAEFVAVPVGSQVLQALAAHLLTRWPQPLELASVSVWLPTQAAAQRLRALLAAHGCRLFPSMRTYAWDETRDGPLPGLAPAPAPVERLAWHAAVRDAISRLEMPLPPSALTGRQAQGVQALVNRLIDYDIPPDMVNEAVPESMLLHWRVTAALVTHAWAEAARLLAVDGMDLFAAARARGRAELARRVSGGRGPHVAVGLVDAVPGQMAILRALAAHRETTVMMAGTPDEQPLIRQLVDDLGGTPFATMDVDRREPDIAMAETASGADETRTISRAIRHALVEGNTRIGVICPDGASMERVFSRLRADGVAVRRVDGLPLGTTRAGQLATRILRVLAATAMLPFSGEAPLAFSELGGHLSMREATALAVDWAALERDVWRGVIVRSWDDAVSKASQAGLAESVRLLQGVFSGIGLMTASQWKTWLEQAMDTLAPTWRDDWGAAECQLWMAEWAGDTTPLDGLELAAWAYQDMEGWRVPVPASPGEGQVFLWAPKDAVLQDCDFLVIAGLNEGNWPHADDSPMISSAMLERLGIPGPASRDALAEYDWGHFPGAAPRLLLTRTRIQGDEEAVPSRFWQRLRTPGRLAVGDVFTPAPVERVETLPATQLGAWPPLDETWPRTWSASWVKAVMDCPYKAVGERLMTLSDMEPFGAMPDKATSGTLVHGWVEAFWQQKPGWPSPWEGLLTAASRADAETHFETLAQYGLRQEPRLVQRLWAPRVPRLAAALVGEWIKDAAAGRKPEMLETWLTLHWEQVSVGAQADRIDRTDTGFVIVDYKTGQLPTWDSVAMGRQPQLPLEALILSSQENFSGMPVAGVEYWQLRGYGDQPLKRAGRDAARVSGWVESAQDGLHRLTEALGRQAVFPATPEPEGACKYCALAGLCRRRETDR